MSTRIQYSPTSQAGRSVAKAVCSVMTALADLRRADAILTSAMNGDTWTALAGDVGGGISDIQARDLWTLIRNAKTAIDVAPIAELSRLDQA